MIIIEANITHTIHIHHVYSQGPSNVNLPYLRNFYRDCTMRDFHIHMYAYLLNEPLRNFSKIQAILCSAGNLYLFSALEDISNFEGDSRF